jgi:hypothetical protein
MSLKVHIDTLTQVLVSGWAWNPNNSDEIIRLIARVESEVVGTCSATLFRRDLLNAHIGTGYHGFSLKFDRELSLNDEKLLSIAAGSLGQDELKVPLPKLNRTTSRVRAPEWLSPANAIAALAPSLDAKNVFDHIEWITPYLQANKPYNIDFFTKMMMFNRLVSGDELRNNSIESKDNQRNTVVQFWDTVDIPEDIMGNILENSKLFGCEHHFLFNDELAKEFIDSSIGSRAVDAYNYCHHPAMKSDYFRLCFLYAHGGIYIDADNVMRRSLPQVNVCDNTLHISALLREKKLVNGAFHWRSLAEFMENAKIDDIRGIQDWVIVFANDVMAANPLNEIIKVALIRATVLIEECRKVGKPANIHVVTGPTNITESILIALFKSALDGQKYPEVKIFDRNDFIKMNSTSYKTDDRYWVNSEKSNPGYVPILG